MNYLWDTGILLHRIRQSPLFYQLDAQYLFTASGNFPAISFVTVGEIYSLKFQLNWGEKKSRTLEEVLRQIKPLPIERKDILLGYAMIDTYSQGKLSGKPLPQGMTSRNMGKNDIWIAATTFATNSSLVTLDSDFDHLHNVFIEVIKPGPA